MEYTIIAPKALDATINLPASKSISNRALVIKALAGGTTPPENLSDCDDTEVIIKALKDMPEVIDIGAAGTSMRFLTAYLAVTQGEHTLTGSARMKHRPIAPLVEALQTLGADIRYEGETGFPPLHIKGGSYEGGLLTVPGNISSQYISALLMIGPVLKQGLTLHLTGDIVSRPYIDLTLWVMHAFGADAEWSDIDTVTVKPKPYDDQPFFVESDWSAASYWYEMMALSNNADNRIVLTGLMDGSRQGDSTARYIFSMLGVKTTFKSHEKEVPTNVVLRQYDRRLPRLDFDFSNVPDIAQTLVVCCCMKGIPFHFEGLQTLRIKETDRIAALKRELLKLGFVLRDIGGRELVWDGERVEPTYEPIDTYKDHRMALAFAPAAFVLPSITIRDPLVVTKSYTHFWNDLRSVGFKIEER